MQPTLRAVKACSPQCTLRSSSSTCAATCPARATTSCSAPGSMAGIEPPPPAAAAAGSSPRGVPLSRIRRSRLLATNWVRRPSRSTVPSSSRALASVARRPSGSCCRAATAAAPPPAAASGRLGPYLPVEGRGREGAESFRYARSDGARGWGSEEPRPAIGCSAPPIGGRRCAQQQPDLACWPRARRPLSAQGGDVRGAQRPMAAGEGRQAGSCCRRRTGLWCRPGCWLALKRPRT
uniref:Uncharacterized protein n=1 Tax=Melopsittacus undulatus TaxID=13146 RepID=A0A8V5H607_MELUD